MAQPLRTLDDFAPAGMTVGIGDVNADQAAFEAAMTYMDHDQILGDLYQAPPVFVRPGKYKVRGDLGGSNYRINLFAEPRSVIIQIVEDAFFLNVPNFLDSFRVSGFDFVGGRGALHHTFTGNNVTRGPLIFEHNLCLDYTVCALGSEAEDTPYWRIRENSFTCSATATNAKGVVLGGLLDEGVIERNLFTRNNTHLQVGPLNSGSLIIRENDFISIQDDHTDRDVWIIPSLSLPPRVPKSFGTNCGQGTILRSNKFGNEGIKSPVKKAPRLLVAAHAGVDRVGAAPDLAWKDGNDGENRLAGLSIGANRITTANTGTSDGPNASFAKIYIEKMDQVTFSGDNVIDGGRFDYLFEFVPGTGAQRQVDFTNTHWDVQIGAGLRGSYGLSLRHGVSNSPIGLIDDPTGIAPSPNTSLPIADPLAVTLASASSAVSWYYEPGVSGTPTTDIDGTSTATLVSWTGSGPLVVLALPDLSAHAGRTAWIVGAFKAGPAAAKELQVRLESYTGLQLQYFNVHPVRSEWTTVASSFVVPIHNGTTMQLRLGIPSWAVGANQVVLSDFRVIVGRSPLI